MRGRVKKDHIWGGLVIASFLSVILAFSSLGCIPQILEARRSAWEQRARATLRHIGESELAYQNTYNDRHWGSWDALVDEEYIQNSQVIENYSIWASTDESLEFYSYATFTIVAFPRKTYPPGYLATFSLREDHILRVYRPETSGVNAWGEDGDYGTMTWEPIR
jgi:hypothetical protein